MGQEGGSSPKGIPPHLVVKLKPGWRYDESVDVFISPKGRAKSPHADLPRGSRIVYMLPDLARADPVALSIDERQLARYLHVFFPKGTTVSDYLALASSWACVEDVELPPEISLPEV